MDGIVVRNTCECCPPVSSSNDDKKFDKDHWRTTTKDTYGVPVCERKTLGRRRDLVKNMICERVLQKIEADEVVVVDGTNPSEYNDSYCDAKFIPYLDKLLVDGDILHTRMSLGQAGRRAVKCTCLEAPPSPLIRNNMTFSTFQILAKYPLYCSNNQTIYKDQIDKGSLKARTEISDFNEPFRKNCTFTTSPEYAVREPTGGF